MGNALHALLGTNTDVKKDVHIRRLGVNFVVKAISGGVLEQAQKECTFGGLVNQAMLGAALIEKACVEPDFGDRSLIDHYGAEDAADCVKKALLAGEISKINEAILTVSGFGDDEIDFPNS